MGKKSDSPGRRLAEALTKERLETLLDAVGPKTLLEKIKTISDHDDDISITGNRLILTDRHCHPILKKWRRTWSP